LQRDDGEDVAGAGCEVRGCHAVEGFVRGGRDAASLDDIVDEVDIVLGRGQTQPDGNG
jgi:hypothetical protein